MADGEPSGWHTINRLIEDHPIWATATFASTMVAVRLLFAALEDRGFLATLWLVGGTAALAASFYAVIALGTRKSQASRRRDDPSTGSSGTAT